MCFGFFGYKDITLARVDSTVDYLERSQRSRTPSERGALLVAENAQRKQASERAQRGRARNAQKAALKAARISNRNSNYESFTDTQANLEDFTYQEETLVDGPTLQRALDSFAAAQPSQSNSAPVQSLDFIPAHSSRLPPPSIHSTSTIIAPPRPVALGSGHHVSHPAITPRQMKRSIKVYQPGAKRPRIGHTLSDDETEIPEPESEDLSFHAPTPAQPRRRFRASIVVNSSPAPSPRPSRSPSPCTHASIAQESQAPSDDTQTIPEVTEMAEVHTQAVPETPTQRQVPNIADSTRRSLSQTSSVSLGADTSNPPRYQSDLRINYSTQPNSSQQRTAATSGSANQPTLNSRTLPAPPIPAQHLSQGSATTRAQHVGTSEGPPLSQPTHSTSTLLRSNPDPHVPADITDGIPPIGGVLRGTGRSRARARAPGRTRTRDGRAHSATFGDQGGVRDMSPSEQTNSRNLGTRRMTPQPNKRAPPLNSSQQRRDKRNHFYTTTAPYTTPRALRTNPQLDRGGNSSAVAPPFTNSVEPRRAIRLQPLENLAGPSSTRTQITAGSSNTKRAPNHPNDPARTKPAGSDPLARSVSRLRSQIAAIRSSDPTIARPTPENGAELVSDDEELRATETAAAKDRDPNGRRSKPSSRNTHGAARLVLQLAKLHLWAYALFEGPYQTRAVFTTWSRIIWRETWAMELPGMIANIATQRGRVKERLRQVVEFIIGFNQFAMTPNAVTLNIAAFQRHHPNSFHCLEQEPERRGHYESELMHHAFAVALFHNEGSVGAIFHEYFDTLESTTIAYILANIQFCLEEWSTGRHENRDLSTGQMLAKFESHMQAWKQFKNAAPRRALNLARQWFDYGLHYSNAQQPAEEQGLLPSQAAEFRTDTPTPDEREEPDELDTAETLDKRVTYMEQTTELGLDEEPGDGSGDGDGEEMAESLANEWMDEEEWEQAPDERQVDDEGW
ncbi:hypothetical protein BN14_11380 [Rhizoctonia solani AG-1 IB]|uniref:DUF6532 domain-containing protein n=1 Tax=Thanatephorus cucumeris (strain AG1-IB / isolate 7/3/14) TaxID=1108050 RepID=M5CCQ2_THACB|nr:hypothetical protein BN14_11380 [Rhizoctonia solani AG-1 IB]